VTSQVTLLGVVSVVSVAWNWKEEPVATVAVAGVTVTRIPESRATVALPVFFLLEFEVATMLTVGGGLGTVGGPSRDSAAPSHRGIRRAGHDGREIL
jgi:hypothetical protein